MSVGILSTAAQGQVNLATSLQGWFIILGLGLATDQLTNQI